MGPPPSSIGVPLTVIVDSRLHLKEGQLPAGRHEARRVYEASKRDGKPRYRYFIRLRASDETLVEITNLVRAGDIRVVE